CATHNDRRCCAARQGRARQSLHSPPPLRLDGSRHGRRDEPPAEPPGTADDRKRHRWLLRLERRARQLAEPLAAPQPPSVEACRARPTLLFARKMAVTESVLQAHKR